MTFTITQDGDSEHLHKQPGPDLRPDPRRHVHHGEPLQRIGRDSDETQHQVTLTQPFYMQTTEVTQAQWEAVMGSNPSLF